MCGRCYISRIGEVLLSISSAYHIHPLCKMHFESCAISHDYQSKRYENNVELPFQRACSTECIHMCKVICNICSFVLEELLLGL